MDSANIPVWELLQKQMIWKQLSFIHNKKVLDFGSRKGITCLTWSREFVTKRNLKQLLLSTI
ncbi:hypothetical protein [uncultured Clostridium sp.]|uniref:hypothetical protein n=1 Tax=uncultured Clostridium sp. TaxID=59620 RepID=UPI0028EA83F7|nr:hypothetical protein [uncultured Clostridium sp.]